MIAFCILLYCLVKLYNAAITENNIPCLIMALFVLFYMLVIRPQMIYNNMDNGGAE